MKIYKIADYLLEKFNLYKLGQSWKVVNDLDGYWITPQGQFINVGNSGHAPYISQHPELLGMSYEDLKFLSKNSLGNTVTAIAISKGFIHIGIYPNKVNISANSQQLIEKYREQIDKLARSHKIIPTWRPSLSGTPPTITTNITSYLRYLPKEELV